MSLRRNHNLGWDMLQRARDAWKSGDFDTARATYQKMAYANIAPTQEIAQFAGDDPLYQGVLSIIIQNLEEREPILQSEFTSKVKQVYGEQAANLVRYVTYFAEVRGELIREKKGRSYNLYLPENYDRKAKYEGQEHKLEHKSAHMYLDLSSPQQIEAPKEKTPTKKQKYFWWSVAIGLAIVQIVKYLTK